MAAREASRDISTLADGLLEDSFKIYDTILSRLKNVRIIYDNDR